MSDRKLYVLTDDAVKRLTQCARDNGSVAADYAADELTPLNTDETVERMARAMLDQRYEDQIRWDETVIIRAAYLTDARAALDALTKEEA